MFIFANLVQQLYLIGKGITLKQMISIDDKMKENLKNKKSNANLENLINLSMKKILNNLLKFFFSKVESSLIVPERDLVENST